LKAAIPIGRLKRRSEFLRVAGAGVRCARPGLVLQAAPGRVVGGPARVGFTVTKKVGDAVTRNRVRRRLRAAAAQVLPGRAAPGTDYVMIGRAATLNRRYSDLVGDLEAALTRLGARPGGANK
jgi:ribonuclease P protein component